MTRKNMAEILKNSSVNISVEYNRLYSLFFLNSDRGDGMTMSQYIDSEFASLSIRGTCLSLNEFNNEYSFHFYCGKVSYSLDDLVSFSEYCYNLTKAYQQITYISSYNPSLTLAELIIAQINKLIEKIGYMPLTTEDGIVIFVEKSPATVAVAEIVDVPLSLQTLRYNHHSMKGDLQTKRTILHLMADYLEPKRQTLRQINSTLEKQLFILFNNYNIRHNNIEGENTNPKLSTMSNEELENLYDNIYQMWLLAVLEIDNLSRKERIAEYLPQKA